MEDPDEGVPDLDGCRPLIAEGFRLLRDHRRHQLRPLRLTTSAVAGSRYISTWTPLLSVALTSRHDVAKPANSEVKEQRSLHPAPHGPSARRVTNFSFWHELTWILLTYIWVQMGSLILVGAGTKNQM
jgi:hypothetical protein